MLNIRSLNDVAKLPNGVLMPRFGLGVWQAEGNDVVNAVKWAVEGGYRHIDTAAIYKNEPEVGVGLKECGVSRHDIFVTSKLFMNGYDFALEHCEKTLKDLQTDYLDLYLIHWPHPQEGNQQFIDAWKGLEKLYKDGKTRAIGVANFTQEHIEVLKKNCDILPMVNQFECHPFYQRRDLQQYCKDNGIQYEAYSPLAGSAVFIEAELFRPLAEKYNKTVAQLVLRFELQENIIVIPKSVKKERILSNADVFDFVISDEDMKTLRGFDKNLKITCADPNQTWPEFMKAKEERLKSGAKY